MANLTRRQWLGQLGPAALDATAGAVERRINRSFPSQSRPPGCVPEPLFQALCTRCGACSEACPYGAVFVFVDGVDAGTPVMRPEQRACHMCDGFPCASACAEGALVVPDSPEVCSLGSARIVERDCLPFAGPECGACADLCPPGVGALSISQRRPVIDTERCIGCGICIEACPCSPPTIVLDPPA